jgi:predicted CopG family antitoxin
VPEVTLDEDAYELLEAQRHEDESFSDAIRRLLGPGPPEEDLADGSETMEDVAETAGDEDAEMGS